MVEPAVLLDYTSTKEPFWPRVSPGVEVGGVREESYDGLFAGLCLPRIKEIDLVPTGCALNSHASKQLPATTTACGSGEKIHHAAAVLAHK